MQHVAAIFYDFDGTLVDSAEGIAAALRAAIGEVFPDVTLPPLRPLIGPPLGIMLQTLLPTASSDERETVAARFKSLYDGGLCCECDLFPSVLETLARLHDGGRPAFLMTNKRAVPTRQMLAHFGLEPRFRDWLGSDSPPGFGSKGDMVRHLVDKHRLRAARCLLVGDSRDDFEAAQTVEMPFVAVAYGYGNAPELSRGPRLEAFDELTGLLEE